MTMKIRGGVERVTVLRPDDSGNIVREKYKVDDLDDDLGIDYIVRDRAGLVRRGEVSERLGQPKKLSKVSRALDKRIHKLARGNSRTVSRYMTLHDRSNRIKKNGWVRDLVKNLRKARRKP
jgi:hypothetical protein